MAASILYYVTDRSAFPGDELARRQQLLEKIAEAAKCGVDFIQLRERDLSVRELESLAREAVQIICSVHAESHRRKTALLINSRMDVALAVGADGVHLRSHDISAEDVRSLWKCARPEQQPLISVACHSPQDVARAATEQATLAIFAPVFEKKDLPGSIPAGPEALRRACRERIPVLALGGVTMQNAKSCVDAGAAGISAIRLFQENDIAAIVRQLSSW
ncbi:MAG: thiamine phosphate synthase [Candidatus Sulfotelmatobacter sp.]